MSDSVAQGVKDNRRLASFTLDDINAFDIRLKGLYDSELEQWYKRCPRDSWKYSLIKNEYIIRANERKLKRRLEYIAMQSERWKAEVELW